MPGVHVPQRRGRRAVCDVSNPPRRDRRLHHPRRISGAAATVERPTRVLVRSGCRARGRSARPRRRRRPSRRLVGRIHPQDRRLRRRSRHLHLQRYHHRRLRLRRRVHRRGGGRGRRPGHQQRRRPRRGHRRSRRRRDIHRGTRPRAPPHQRPQCRRRHGEPRGATRARRGGGCAKRRAVVAPNDAVDPIVPDRNHRAGRVRTAIRARAARQDDERRGDVEAAIAGGDVELVLHELLNGASLASPPPPADPPPAPACNTSSRRYSPRRSSIT